MNDTAKCVNTSDLSILIYGLMSLRTLVKSTYQKIIFSYFSTKTYVVGTQKNRLNESVLLSTQNIY